MLKARERAVPFEAYLAKQRRRRRTWSLPESPDKGNRRKRALGRALRPIGQVGKRDNSASSGQVGKTHPAPSQPPAVDTGAAQFLGKAVDLPYAVRMQRQAVRRNDRPVFLFN